MGLTIAVYNITSLNEFTLSYSATPYGTYINFDNPLNGGIWESSSVRNYLEDPILIPDVILPTLWIKINDVVTGRYIIENIQTHDYQYFNCFYDCILEGNIINLTPPTPTPSPTPSPTATATPTPTPTPTATNIPCNIVIDSIITTDPNNFDGNNGTATITFSGGIGPYSYTLDTVPMGVITSPIYITGLLALTSYDIVITDSNLCQVSSSFTLGENAFVFDADYIMLTYEFTDGRDLDTRTRIVTPNIGQNTQQEYVGWAVQSHWPLTYTTGPIITWGNDNTGLGYESVLIDLNVFRVDYPLDTEIVIDARCFWYGTVGVNPVNVAATLWRGGTPMKNGCYTTQYFCWTNPSADATYLISSVPKVITSAGLPTKSLSSGERAVTFTYNLITNVGVIDNNDTITPSV